MLAFIQKLFCDLFLVFFVVFFNGEKARREVGGEAKGKMYGL